MDRWKHRHKKMTPDEVDDRYLAANQTWDERTGTPLKRARNWRLFALALLGVQLVQMLANIYLANRSTIEAHVIESKCGEDVQYVGAIGQADWTPGLGIKKKKLWDWIKHLRSVSSDPNVILENRAILQTTTISAATQLLTQQKDNPFELYKTMRRTTHLIAINGVQNAPDTFRVQWEERRFDKSGVLQGKDQFIGEFHIAIHPPKTLAQMRDNPSGVYVSFFEINKKQGQTP